MPYEAEGITHLTAEELKAKIADPQNRAIVIDVREPEEYVEGHIPGVPLVPMGEIPNHAEKWDKNEEYVFVCRSGNRSLNVALYLKNLGFDNVRNFAGGMLGWDGDISTGPEHVVTEANMDQLRLRK